MTSTVEGSTGDNVATSLWFTLAITKMRGLSMPKISYLNSLFNNLHGFVIFFKILLLNLVCLFSRGGRFLSPGCLHMTYPIIALLGFTKEFILVLHQ